MAHIYAIAMPKWGMEMSEGEIAQWRVAVGDSIAAGDELIDIETSKIINTLTAHESGILRRILAPEGATLPVGALLGIQSDASATDAEIDAFIAAHGGIVAVAPTPSAPAAAQEKTSAPIAAAVAPKKSTPDNNGGGDTLAMLRSGADDSAVAASTIARRLAQQYGVNLHNVSGSGRHGRVSKADLEQTIRSAGGSLSETVTQRSDHAQRSSGDDSAVPATPVARRLARELNINLHDCRASGSHGRVGKADVEATAALFALAAGAPLLNTRQTAELNAAAVPQIEAAPLTGMRKTIAARLQSSKQNAPHFRVCIDAQIDQLLAVRKQINDGHTDAKISLNDLLIKACAQALQKVPAVNIQFDGDIVRRFADADIAVAVALDNGLITPIVKAANRKGVVAISNEMRDLAMRAKLGTLKANEFQGGTFSISNLGMFGVKNFDAIINPPQAAILAIGAGEQRPVASAGELKIATVISLSLSSDHRVIDGAVAARFMATLRDFIESPATMLG